MPRGDTQDSKCQKLDNYFRKNQGVASGRLPVPVPSGVKRKSVA